MGRGRCYHVTKNKGMEISLYWWLSLMFSNRGSSSSSYNTFGSQSVSCQIKLRQHRNCKAYIPPEHKIHGVGGWRWTMPPTPGFCVWDTNMLVSKIWKFAFPDAKPPTPNLKFALAPMPNPDASQWNIGCVGSQSKMLALAMYISCFLCRFHLRLVPNANPISGGIWA